MRERKKWKSIALIAAVILVISALFASDFLVLDMNVEPSDYSLSMSDEDSPAQADTALWFDYGTKGNQLFFGISPEASEERIRFFQLNGSDVEELTSLSHEEMQKSFTGNLIAVAEPYRLDIDGDGSEETVFDSARADFGINAFNPVPQIFDSREIPFEPVFSERNRIMVRFNGMPLKNAEVYVKKTDKYESFATDENGYIQGLPNSAIRKGFTAYYEHDGAVYRMYYALEDYGIFTLHFLKAHKPLIAVMLISVAAIIVIQLVRIRISGKSFAYTGFSMGHKGLEKSGRRFLALRWGILFVSMVYFTWFGRLIMQGQTLNYIVVPVFSCPFNLDQITEVPCYYLSHIPYLFNRFGSGLPLRNILYAAVFLITLFVIILFFGRILCGFLCPAGLIQDITYKIRSFFKIRPINVTDRMSVAFTVLKWTWIILFLGFIFTGGDFCQICPVKVFTTAQGGYWTNLVLNGFLAAFILAGSFFINRFWCLMCPLGYIMGILYKFNIFKLKKDCNACTECGACYEACPMRLKNIYTERESTEIQSVDCLMCGECIRNCPENNALYMTLCKRKIYVSSRREFLEKYKKKGRGQNGK